MSIELAGYKFRGPYTSTDNLEDRAGVYAILCPTAQNRYKVIDVGESHEVKTRVETHDRKGCWERHCSSTIKYAVYYTPHMQQPGRKEIEQEIRNRYDPPCGKE